jgi:UDP-N-acetylmuramyl pentapeptide phosphotransferase/UDP-N-acetylglucosamine-1-phosphate transferase
MLAQWAIWAAVALILSILGVAGIRYWTQRRQLFDIPNERSSHKIPTPRGGGLAIVVITLIGIVIYRVGDQTISSGFQVITYVISAGVIIGISLIDDYRGMSARTRLIAHAIGAVGALTTFGYWQKLPLPLLHEVDLGVFGIPITLLWILGLTNAFNFIDGIDGLAGSQAVIVGCGWVLLGGLNGQPIVMMLGLLIACSSLGFLFHNWPPARIFMGDVGSTFLGYTFAVLPLIAARRDPQLIFPGIVLLWVIIFDTILTLIRRLIQGENIFLAHRSHLYQRLVISGYSHLFVTLLYIGLALLGVVLAIMWYQNFPLSDYWILAVLALAAGGLFLFVSSHKKRKLETQADSVL